MNACMVGFPTHFCALCVVLSHIITPCVTVLLLRLRATIVVCPACAVVTALPLSHTQDAAPRITSALKKLGATVVSSLQGCSHVVVRTFGTSARAVVCLLPHPPSLSPHCQHNNGNVVPCVVGVYHMRV